MSVPQTISSASLPFRVPRPGVLHYYIVQQNAFNVTKKSSVALLCAWVHCMKIVQRWIENGDVSVVYVRRVGLEGCRVVRRVCDRAGENAVVKYKLLRWRKSIACLCSGG
ncbi:predicted protein [Sclerotinia sclerotiorum 1980 UF-70]|uniref:Uncharacterized protein n=1 Tax=Sclerotinia sclerotiorum (strain ATCC 18683 / 1980 / Ss-1) TaxID=665079 RepID=A7F5Y6_SCLS1|nr:predicted protein [Sclerotinia sclerotiorum 1980 UF-70]EDN98157.1 predicted protein [Sclerotinia sclerotiorum 1980 UF-70]